MTSELRIASVDDVVQWYGKVPATMKAVLMLIDGKPVAIGGMMRKNGLNVAFMDMKPDASSAPFSVWKGTMKAMKEIISHSRMPVYAQVSEELPTAPAFLRRLGFVPVDEKEEVMVCQVQQQEYP